MPGQLSEFVESLSTAITRRADRYVELREEPTLVNPPCETESQLLDRFERYTAEILERYVPPGPRKRDSLVFTHLYEAEDQSSPEDVLHSAIAALLAAE